MPTISDASLGWLLVCGALVFIMQGGFAALEAGFTRAKNSINVAMKNLTDFMVSFLLFWLVGFGLVYGASYDGLFGTSGFALGWEVGATPIAFFLFQAMFCATAATIISGAVAERMRYVGYLLVTVLVSGLIYPLFAHWAWNSNGGGWLGGLGFVDFAGSTVVHAIGGWVALAALLVIGPRTGRFGTDGEVRRISGSNLPFAVLGVLLLWLGWFGFNGGSTLALTDAVPRVIGNTVLAGPPVD